MLESRPSAQPQLLLWLLLLLLPSLNSRADCLRKFQSNANFGALLFAALVAGKLMMPADADGDAHPHGDADGDAPDRKRPPPPRTISLLWQAVGN